MTATAMKTALATFSPAQRQSAMPHWRSHCSEGKMPSCNTSNLGGPVLSGGSVTSNLGGAGGAGGAGVVDTGALIGALSGGAGARGARSSIRSSRIRPMWPP